jgi:hypothetical protein
MRVAERIELDTATERELGVLSKGRRVEAGRPHGENPARPARGRLYP